MKVLYGGSLAFGATSEHRLCAFRRVLGDVTAFDTNAPENIGSLAYIANRFQSTFALQRLNRNLVSLAEAVEPDLIWLDKPILVFPDTVRRLRRIAPEVVSYMPDDPFGPRRDPSWHLFVPALPEYSAHVVPRDVTKSEFQARGVKRVLTSIFSFEPSVHFPPAAVGLTPPKDFDVTFIGYPHDQRANWIMAMKRQAPELSLGVFGPGWMRHAAELNSLGVCPQGAVWNDSYREVIWRSRLSLSFITQSNRDIMSHKAIEIAAAGTPPIVEPSPIHRRIFEHGKSAFFFEKPADLARLVRKVLATGDESLAEAGKAAAMAVRRAEMSNDDWLRRIILSLKNFPV